MSEATKTPPAPPAVTDKLVLGITARALFDLEQEHKLYETLGTEAYCKYMVQHEDNVLKPGVGFHMIKSFLALNELVGKEVVEVCILSRNTANTSLRLFNSFAHHKLNIHRVALTGGRDTFPYIEAFNVDLFLSANPKTVCRSLEAGVAAAVVYPGSQSGAAQDDVIRIALDGDGVVFSMAAEDIFRKHGLKAFEDHERQHAEVELPEGPMAKFLKKLSRLQSQLGKHADRIEIALITARGYPAQERVIRTLRAWNVRIDSAFFLGGGKKAPIVKAFGAQLFFDNQSNHCQSVSQVAPTAQVLEKVAAA